MSLNIKLIFNGEIHRLSRVPSSYAELQAYCTSVFRFSSFVVRYLDEENDEITIACDDDLLTALASAESLGLQSLRLHVSLPNQSEKSQSSIPSSSVSGEFKSKQPENQKIFEEYEEIPSQMVVWPRHTCDGCNTKPIVGNRFHCTVCPDFDFCEECEKNNQHDHPFIKFSKVTEDQYINLDVTPETMGEKFRELKNLFVGPKPKGLVKNVVKLTDQGAGDVFLRWVVVNSGNCQWPSGCRIEMVKGNASVQFGEVPSLMPGEEFEIVGSAWSDGGRFFGKWVILTPNGKKLGKLKAKGFVKMNLAEKVENMREMGFDPEIAEQALKACGGNLEKAILSLSY